MAELYDTMVSPHNWMSPLGTLINAQLCAALPNVEDLRNITEPHPADLDRFTELAGRLADLEIMVELGREENDAAALADAEQVVGLDEEAALSH